MDLVARAMNVLLGSGSYTGVICRADIKLFTRLFEDLIGLTIAGEEGTRRGCPLQTVAVLRERLAGRLLTPTVAHKVRDAVRSDLFVVPRAESLIVKALESVSDALGVTRRCVVAGPSVHKLARVGELAGRIHGDAPAVST